MRAMLDLNVLLDVVQNRPPHYADSAAVLSAARSGDFIAVVAAHAVTTIFYLVERGANTSTANQTVDWLLQHFEIPAADKAILMHARTLQFSDFEDAVVAAIAAKYGCDYIVSRNAADFNSSPIKAISPADFLQILQTRKPASPAP